MNIYVGNISREATEKDVRQLFEEYGEVTSVTLIKDRYTGQFKGFGFVEMPDQEAAKKAISSLDGQNLIGRPLAVSEAKPRADRKDFKSKPRSRY